MVDARLPDGSRVNAILPLPSVRGPVMTIRKFAERPFAITDMVAPPDEDHRNAAGPGWGGADRHRDRAARSQRRTRIANALDLELAKDGAATPLTVLAFERAIHWAETRTADTPWRERMVVRLERSRVTLRPAEYVALWVALAVVGFAAGLVFSPVGAAAPQLVAEDAAEPLGPEIARVLSETEVGRPLLEALDAMALRLDVPDLNWTVEGVRIQPEVGGRLSEMLRTLSTFMRAREEVRRELRALTARASSRRTCSAPCRS